MNNSLTQLLLACAVALTASCVATSTLRAQTFTYDFVRDWDEKTKTGAATLGRVAVSCSADHVFAGQLPVASPPGLDLVTNLSRTFGTFTISFSRPVDLEVDFSNLSGGSAEQFRRFSSLPNSVSVAPSHNWGGGRLTGGVVWTDTSTFTWHDVTTLSFQSGDSVPGGSQSTQEIAVRITLPSGCPGEPAPAVPQTTSTSAPFKIDPAALSLPCRGPHSLLFGQLSPSELNIHSPLACGGTCSLVLWPIIVTVNGSATLPAGLPVGYTFGVQSVCLSNTAANGQCVNLSAASVVTITP